jgi:hypothetical protein
MIKALKNSIETHISKQTNISKSFTQKLSKLGNKRFIKQVVNRLQIQENHRNYPIPKSRAITKTCGAIVIDDDSVMETDTGGHSPQFKGTYSTYKTDSDIEYVGTNQHTPKSTYFVPTFILILVDKTPSLLLKF